MNPVPSCLMAYGLTNAPLMPVNTIFLFFLDVHHVSAFRDWCVKGQGLCAPASETLHKNARQLLISGSGSHRLMDDRTRINGLFIR